MHVRALVESDLDVDLQLLVAHEPGVGLSCYATEAGWGKFSSYHQLVLNRQIGRVVDEHLVLGIERHAKDLVALRCVGKLADWDAVRYRIWALSAIVLVEDIVYDSILILACAFIRSIVETREGGFGVLNSLEPGGTNKICDRGAGRKAAAIRAISSISSGDSMICDMASNVGGLYVTGFGWSSHGGLPVLTVIRLTGSVGISSTGKWFAGFRQVRLEAVVVVCLDCTHFLSEAGIECGLNMTASVEQTTSTASSQTTDKPSCHPDVARFGIQAHSPHIWPTMMPSTLKSRWMTGSRAFTNARTFSSEMKFIPKST